MSLIQMSISGGVLILAVIVLRALALNRLPKGTFLALWAVAALRLLAPFSIPSPASVYNLAGVVETPVSAPITPASPLPALDFAPGAAPAAAPAIPSPAPEVGTDPLFLVWMVGMIVCGTYFLVSYLRCRREFRTALPVEEGAVMGLRPAAGRSVSLRISDRVDAPLTYGLLRPVILLPKGWAEDPRLAYALDHELAHIRHLDALWKLLLALTACVHWFNPLVWCMFVLANRDLELRCDEVVVRRLGVDSRSQYAQALISLEEKRSGLTPFASAFNKNAIEERIIAIMKIKKRSLAAILAAVLLVCCVGVAFATSAADKTFTPYPQVEDGTFTKAELDRLASLWFEGYEDMTIAAYQQKMWTGFDTPEDHAVIERYSRNSTGGGRFDDPDTLLPEEAFRQYFFYVFQPLTGEHWRERTFPGIAQARTEDGGLFWLEFNYTLHILYPDTITVGDYQQIVNNINLECRTKIQIDREEVDLDALARQLSTDALTVTIEAGLPLRDYDPVAADAELHVQSSRETAALWDEKLSPYAPLGLTWKFDDPDMDGNGLTMWWGGKEVRGICDERKGLWITEHSGNSAYSDGAVELYTVYTDGVLTGLRLATPEEQTEWDTIRQTNHSVTIPRGTLYLPYEPREFPRATWEHYESLLALRTVEYMDLPPWASYPYPDARDLTLEDFNQRLLDWANENPITWDRINCDVLWNDYGVELTTDERQFVAVTCLLSGTENGQMVRALYTGGSEQDPRLSASMPMRSNEENGVVSAWCDLYYSLSYHIPDKSAVTVRERDACVGGMMSDINAFWQDTDFETLLGMTEADVVARFSAFAAENSTAGVQISPVTADDIHFEAYDERGID